MCKGNYELLLMKVVKFTIDGGHKTIILLTRSIQSIYEFISIR